MSTENLTSNVRLTDDELLKLLLRYRIAGDGSYVDTQVVAACIELRERRDADEPKACLECEHREKYWAQFDHYPKGDAEPPTESRVLKEDAEMNAARAEKAEQRLAKYWTRLQAIVGEMDAELNGAARGVGFLRPPGRFGKHELCPAIDAPHVVVDGECQHCRSAVTKPARSSATESAQGDELRAAERHADETEVAHCPVIDGPHRPINGICIHCRNPVSEDVTP